LRALWKIDLSQISSLVKYRRNNGHTGLIPFTSNMYTPAFHDPHIQLDNAWAGEVPVQTEPNDGVEV